jgi:putative NADPH-quinone reductase
MKKILIINGHPREESFTKSIIQSYILGVSEHNNSEIKEIVIRDLDFNPNLQFGFKKRMELEPDLLKSLEKIMWCDHMVWVHPVWWGGLPSLTKGFIDRLFLPGLVFSYKENSVWWDKLLKGKTGRIIYTLDQPTYFYWLIYNQPSINQLKKTTLEFCGVKPVKTTGFGPIKNSTEKQRLKWLNKVYLLGKSMK